VKHTQVPNLDLICSGPLPPNPAEMIHADRFREMIDGLSKRYDKIIIDTPPIIAVTDAVILSQFVDGVIMVVKCGKSTKEMVRQAKRQLMDVNANIVGAILNDLNMEDRHQGYYYYYYYYRRYGYYYGEGDSKKKHHGRSA
jgi:capsular exopolysaccharide synthesis family protein